MIHLYVKSEIVDYIDGVDLEVDPDIKREIRTDVIDVTLSFVLTPGDCGTLVGMETYGGEPSGRTFSVNQGVVGTIKVLHRTEEGEEDCGTLMVLPGLMSMPELGMSDAAQDMAVNGMLATLQVQQWLEQQGILNKDPAMDKDNMRILVDVIDKKPAVRILSADEEVTLAIND